VNNIQKGQQEKPVIRMSLERLRGRQSVWTTFRLSKNVIVLLGIAAEQFGLQQIDVDIY
jgi:hypothetical protein